MPFKPIDKLKENPAVKIFFSGLMIIQPDDNAQNCEVFVNRVTLDHDFSIEVREKRANMPDSVLMRHFGPLSFISPPEDPLLHGFHIISSNPKGLEMYVGPPLPGGEDSLSHAVDLTAGTFQHDQKLEVDSKGGRPSISLNDGIFYTAEKTPLGFPITLSKGGNELNAKLAPFANLIGANIYLEAGDELVLRWLERDIPRGLSITRTDGVTYEIYIMNEPLFTDPESAEAHDEFGEYYKILSPVAADKRFKLEVKGQVPPKFKGTPRTLCMSVLLNAKK